MTLCPLFVYFLSLRSLSSVSSSNSWVDRCSCSSFFRASSCHVSLPARRASISASASRMKAVKMSLFSRLRLPLPAPPPPPSSSVRRCARFFPGEGATGKSSLAPEPRGLLPLELTLTRLGRLSLPICQARSASRSSGTLAPCVTSAPGACGWGSTNGGNETPGEDLAFAFPGIFLLSTLPGAQTARPASWRSFRARLTTGCWEGKLSATQLAVS
mmetsp:Transcript_6854/g.19235  ORF Transcript_6854/g.19235 Transcript_6854/m.19235 type:complete len:215 (+) Transcript_6854:284-928(+)